MWTGVEVVGGELGPANSWGETCASWGPVGVGIVVTCCWSWEPSIGSGRDFITSVLRWRLGARGFSRLYGSKRLVRLDVAFSDPSRPAERRGKPVRGPVRSDTEVSISSGSPLYRRIPSAHISTLGGFRKCVLSRYSGLISREASSGRDDGERKRPLSTSSTL